MTKQGTVRRFTRRCAAVALAVGVLAALAATPASAQVRPDDGKRRIGIGNQFVREGESVDTAVIAVDGDATVAGSTTESVFVVKGNAVVSGQVDGDVIVINGNSRISGRVDGDVVVLDGRAVVKDGAVVRGDVSSTDEPRVERGATVTGDVDHIDVTGIFTAIGFTILGYIWLAVTVSTALLGLLILVLFRRAFEVAANTERTDTGKSLGLGLAVAVGLPIVSVLAITTLVGLPFGLGFLGAQGLLWSVGYVISALCLGRSIIKAPRSAFGAFFAGWGILRVAALIPGIGAIVWIGASVFGIGALVIAATRASRAGETPLPATPEPPPPTPVAIPAAPAEAGTTATATTTKAPAKAGTEAKAAGAKKAPAKAKPKAKPAEGS